MHTSITTTYMTFTQYNVYPRTFLFAASTYASVLTDPHRRLAPTPTSDSSRAPKSHAPTQPWAPRIVVSDSEGPSRNSSTWSSEDGLSWSSSPQQRQQQHAQLEKYWRDVQCGESRHMQRGFSLAALGGPAAKTLSEAAHESRANMQCASTEASRHALLARNTNIMVDAHGGALRFLGFTHVESPGRTGSCQAVTGRHKAITRSEHIDLHGVDVRNALQFTDSLLQFCSRGNGGHYEVHLIVGKGNNSLGGIARLRPALKTHLQRRNVKAVSSTDSEVVFIV
jgi:hypothetical protein